MKLKKENIGSYLLIALVFTLSVVTALFMKVPINEIAHNYNYSVLIIMVVMELFTNLIVETRIMKKLAVQLAILSRGTQKVCVGLFGILMFLVSAFLNNITAVMMILPVIFVLLKALGEEKAYVCRFFSVLVALCNLGGMATPIGDAPAIIVMSSGITSFGGYLVHAFPLALITSIILLCIWTFTIKKEKKSQGTRLFAVEMLISRYRNNKVRMDVLIPVLIVFICMFLCWCLIPSSVLPTEMVAIVGYVIAMIIAAMKGIEIKQCIDAKASLTIGAFLFMADVISGTGVLIRIADYLQNTISDPKMLLLVVMLVTSVVSGLVSAGPATAALLPIIVSLCTTTLTQQSALVATAFAASICAGSSLFMWSATAGFILSDKIEKARLSDKGEAIIWTVKEYLPYGIINYLIQMGFAVGWVMLLIK